MGLGPPIDMKMGLSCVYAAGAWTAQICLHSG